MRKHHSRVSALALLVALAGCAPTSNGTETAEPVEPSAPGVASASPTEQAEAFPTAAFTDIREEPVSEDAATECRQSIIAAEPSVERVVKAAVPIEDSFEFHAR